MICFIERKNDGIGRKLTNKKGYDMFKIRYSLEYLIFLRRNRMSERKKYKQSTVVTMILVVFALLGGWQKANDLPEIEKIWRDDALSSEDIPDFSGTPYVTINNHIPFFSENDYTLEPFEQYSDLDEFGRCGVAFANICQEIMPTEKRGEIGSIKPSGWHTVRYDDLVEGKYLYNRCHLIGYQLAGENANEKNLITGTRYFNVEGMLPFENEVNDYVKKTNHHVLYRVTPIFEGNNLVAKGVQMEAFSVEDNGEGVCFHVFVYNHQPGIKIDYLTGESCLL